MQEIMEQFKKVIEYSQGIENPKIETLFKDWEKNKKRFIDIFGGLTYDFPFETEFPISQEQQNVEIEDFIADMYAASNFESDIITFLNKQKDGIRDNKVVKEWNDGEIPIGMKLSKSLKFLIKDKDILHSLQSKLSQFIQEKSFKGKITLSVHPLDYLSVSENCHNWTSCHSLHGDYRSGNIGYMADPHTIICYVKSEEDRILPGFPEEVPWNSKRWRVLLYVNEDNNLIFLGKQYPYAISRMEEFIQKEVNHKLNPSAVWSNYETAGFTMELNNQEYVRHSIFKDCEGTYHFNDCLTSSSYNGRYSYNINAKNFSPIEVGRPVQCMDCGNGNIEYSEQMRCFSCGYIYSDDCETVCCCECGDEVYIDDACEVEGRFYCTGCVAIGIVSACDRCGDVGRTQDMVFIKERDANVCESCAEWIEEERQKVY